MYSIGVAFVVAIELTFLWCIRRKRNNAAFHGGLLGFTVRRGRDSSFGPGIFSFKKKSLLIPRESQAVGFLLSFVYFVHCGEGGIRTLDTLRYARFPSECTRPLCDLSVS